MPRAEEPPLTTPRNPVLPLTFAIAGVTLLLVAGVLGGPALVACADDAEGIAACVRARIVAAGLLPDAAPDANTQAPEAPAADPEKPMPDSPAGDLGEGAPVTPVSQPPSGWVAASAAELSSPHGAAVALAQRDAMIAVTGSIAVPLLMQQATLLPPKPETGLIALAVPALRGTSVAVTLNVPAPGRNIVAVSAVEPERRPALPLEMTSRPFFEAGVTEHILPVAAGAALHAGTRLDAAENPARRPASDANVELTPDAMPLLVSDVVPEVTPDAGAQEGAQEIAVIDLVTTPAGGFTASGKANADTYPPIRIALRPFSAVRMSPPPSVPVPPEPPAMAPDMPEVPLVVPQPAAPPPHPWQSDRPESLLANPPTPAKTEFAAIIWGPDPKFPSVTYLAPGAATSSIVTLKAGGSNPWVTTLR